MFTDPDFPHDGEALAWREADETYVSADSVKDASWHRAKCAFP